MMRFFLGEETFRRGLEVKLSVTATGYYYQFVFKKCVILSRATNNHRRIPTSAYKRLALETRVYSNSGLSNLNNVS